MQSRSLTSPTRLSVQENYQAMENSIAKILKDKLELKADPKSPKPQKQQSKLLQLICEPERKELCEGGNLGTSVRTL